MCHVPMVPWPVASHWRLMPPPSRQVASRRCQAPTTQRAALHALRAPRGGGRTPRTPLGISAAAIAGGRPRGRRSGSTSNRQACEPSRPRGRRSPDELQDAPGRLLHLDLLDQSLGCPYRCLLGRRLRLLERLEHRSVGSAVSWPMASHWRLVSSSSRTAESHRRLQPASWSQRPGASHWCLVPAASWLVASRWRLSPSSSRSAVTEHCPVSSSVMSGARGTVTGGVTLVLGAIVVAASGIAPRASSVAAAVGAAPLRLMPRLGRPPGLLGVVVAAAAAVPALLGGGAGHHTGARFGRASPNPLAHVHLLPLHEPFLVEDLRDLHDRLLAASTRDPAVCCGLRRSRLPLRIRTQCRRCDSSGPRRERGARRSPRAPKPLRRTGRAPH